MIEMVLCAMPNSSISDIMEQGKLDSYVFVAPEVIE